jgi:hypothetical protein
MELRQKIVNANELDMELGLAHAAEVVVDRESTDTQDTIKTPESRRRTCKGKQKEAESDNHEEEEEEDGMESGSWDGNGKPRKFWIPHRDSTSVMGGNPDAYVTTVGGGRSETTRHLSRLSASIDPEDVQWASDFTSLINDTPATTGRSDAPETAQPISYTHYPPFRFAAEFPIPRNLKEKKRVYSRTVWYAGSLWNVYIQKVETAKSTQLGVYLHRAKEKEERNRSVDERISQVETLLRRNEMNRRQLRTGHRADVDEDTSGSGGDPDMTLVAEASNAAFRAAAIGRILRGDGITKASQSPGGLASANQDRTYHGGILGLEDDIELLAEPGKKTPSPTLPLYVDGRPTIKTYFKIYSPSKGGRMLSVYESAPDNFNFSQSWGWKSSSMILDDGMLGYEEGTRARDGKLRFMVVIGNV